MSSDYLHELMEIVNSIDRFKHDFSSCEDREVSFSGSDESMREHYTWFFKGKTAQVKKIERVGGGIVIIYKQIK